MPIRINLLAEQQAAEQARRRDPVKRALWAAGGLLLVLLLWSGSVQFQLIRSRAQLTAEQARWRQIEPSFLEVSNHTKRAGLIERRLHDLQRYASNRFLWTEPLNALQHATDDQVRLIAFNGQTTLKPDKEVAITTNLFMMRPSRRWWSFWSVEPPQTNMHDLASRTLAAITNRADLLRFQSDLIASANVVTNPVQIVAQLAVIKPETITEKITITLRARDYGQPFGSRIDRYFAAITNTACFKKLLGKGYTSVQPDSIQPHDDPTDLISPTDLFIPFTIECVFPEAIRANE